MRIIISCFLVSISFGIKAQNAYLDSLSSYQKKYKSDLAAIIKNDTSYVRFFPVDSNYKITAEVKRLRNQPLFGMASSSGVPRQAQEIMIVTFKLNGKSLMLHGYQLLSLRMNEGYQDHFFIPFTDSTSGVESYEGGRYLDFTLRDITNEKLVLDFNKAYNPYCAFVTGYACPIPPAENALEVAIHAGESAYKKSH